MKVEHNMNIINWKHLALSLSVGNKVLFKIPHNYGVFEGIVTEYIPGALKINWIHERWYDLNVVTILNFIQTNGESEMFPNKTENEFTKFVFNDQPGSFDSKSNQTNWKEMALKLMVGRSILVKINNSSVPYEVIVTRVANGAIEIENRHIGKRWYLFENITILDIL